MTHPVWAHEFNAEKNAICVPRWAGWVYPKSKHDPCGGCPLSTPCIKVNVQAGPESFNRWIDGVNELALKLTHVS